MRRQLQNRTEAGQLLAKQLTAYTNRPDVLVLGLPRGTALLQVRPYMLPLPHYDSSSLTRL